MISKKKVIDSWINKVMREAARGTTIELEDIKRMVDSGKNFTFTSKSDEQLMKEAKMRAYDSMNTMDRFLLKLFKNDLPKGYELNFNTNI